MMSVDHLKVWIILMMIGQVSAVFYNQPKLCPNGSWNANATTFAFNMTIGSSPHDIFIDKYNSIYVPNYEKGYIVVWAGGNSTPTKNVSTSLTNPYSLFVTTADEIYVDSDMSTGRIEKWTLSSTVGIPTMYTCSKCYDIFIDISNNLYCSMYDRHQIIMKSLDSILNALTIIAGTGVAGAAANMLNHPYGIYVDSMLNLYVADYLNHRIQFFSSGELDGITVAGNTSLNNTITLYYPTGIVLDGDDYLYIVDTGNHRIVGSRPGGFQCFLGCSGGSGAQSNQLNQPSALSFDNDGNMFVVDTGNSRIQKFILSTSLCNGIATSSTNNVDTTQANFFLTAGTQSNDVTTASSGKIVSFNRPKLDTYAAWSANAITFASNNTFGTTPYGIFINTNDTIYVAVPEINRIKVWTSNSINPIELYSANLSASFSLFATTNGDIYVSYRYPAGRVDKWTSSTNTTDLVMYVNGSCFDLFVDINDTLYCSMGDLHQVVTKSLNGNSSTATIFRGIGCSGSTAYMLNGPHGIFVDTNFDLYVADCYNHRVQLFQLGQLNGITVAGNTSVNTTITLNLPTGIVLDADGYLFIVDSGNQRIVASGLNGFRCLVGCSRSSGSASNQLASPWQMRFDSDGNMFVTDSANNRVQKFLLLNNSFAPSYNQPKLCSDAAWNPNGITFATSKTIGAYPLSIFVNTNNTIYAANRADSRVQVWLSNSINPTQTISKNLLSPLSLFATNNGDIYVDSRKPTGGVFKWTVNANTGVSVMSSDTFCFSLFVDISNTLYCSLSNYHRVVKRWLNDTSTTLTIVAGTGVAGKSSETLNRPRGIFVNSNLDLYVIDCYNHRVQRFRLGQSDGITVAGSGSANTTITLLYPNGVVLDADSHLFIVDSWNHRIVGSNSNGFRCLVGCTGRPGQAANQFYFPASLSFDSYGNMFVMEFGNSRIQKFILTVNSCYQSTTTPATMQTATGQMTTSKTSTIHQTCFPPTITLIPDASTISLPVEFRRSQDLNIISIIDLNCSSSLAVSLQWTIKGCSSNCSDQIQLGPTIKTTLSELYIPQRTLPYGLYELQLNVIMANTSGSISSSLSVYVQIIPSGITANLIQYGTSMITSSHQQDLHFDPGSYSVDFDENTFNASNWKYEYYCRIYGLYMFPSLNGSFLSIDDPRNDSSNPSCLLNRAGWHFNNSIKSSLTILSGSFQSNRTYQFMVYMENRWNSSLQATGYVLVNIKDVSPRMILISCVIWTLCLPNIDFQLINPTTQVALFSVCTGNCTTLTNITWNIYYGTTNSSSNVTDWTLFNQTFSYQDIWFFGIHTSNFTATNQVFLSNPEITLWRFEAVYTFTSETSVSSLSFVINQPPVYGSCSIDPLNGTTSTLFSILCMNWYDENEIKDYTIHAWTNDTSEEMIIAYSTSPIFQVRLPSGDDQTSLVYLVAYIRDTLDCVIQSNISSVTVIPDIIEMTHLINEIQNSSSELTENPIIRILASENQNVVGQVFTSLSQQFNKMNNEFVNKAVSNGIPVTSISISSLLSQSSQGSSTPLNQSALIEYNKELNSLANARDYVMTFITKLAITTPNSIRIQSSALAQMTKATNQLTRKALMIASGRCYQLARALHSLTTTIPYEDVQTAATQLIQCAANVLSAVNGPLQQRTTILDLDSSRITALPVDYDTDLGLVWANPNLFADGNDFSWETIQKGRNTYYQKQLANQIMNQMNELISLLSSSLDTHLNIGQSFTVDISQVFMSFETKSSELLRNQFLKRIGNGQVQFPGNVSGNLSSNSKISIRSMMEPLAIFGNSTAQSNTNLSRTVSLSIIDQNQNEVLVRTNLSHPIEIKIPRDPNLFIPSMVLQNVTSANTTFHNQLFHLHYLDIISSVPVSVHFEIQPLNTSLAYLFIYKFDQLPQLNSSVNVTDGWTILCPSNLTNESIYTYFIDNQRTSSHRSIVFGLRELNSTEINTVCSNASIIHPPVTNERFNFTSDYQLRTYTSGCYYLDKNNQWKSDGLTVGHLTNHYETQCFSTHLTRFAGGFVVLPASVNWNYVFANADFSKNKTIYLTVICVSIIYILLMIYARYKDNKDVDKLGVTPLPDNHHSHEYFYQIIVFTGHRKDAGTKSNVHFVIHGDGDETHIRTLADRRRKILQRGGVDGFIMAVPKSLGPLNCMRIWHDNTGTGSSSSWFLKYVIVRDLQTLEKFHFICQRWLAVEKDDGKIERVLSVASEMEKRDFSYILTKRTYHSVSDGHLWFSIFSRPPSNQFTRVQRCTCCFVLLFLSMFLNIMYYDLSNEAKTDNSTRSDSLAFGSLYITPQQIIIGIIVEILALVPSLLLVQLFRRLRSRRKQISPLHQALYKIKPHLQMQSEDNKKKKSSLTFPWWCIFVAYGLCIVLVGVSIIFIIARGIEFGDVKTQKWLTSILSGFCSSVLLTQPLKIICLAIVFACFCRNSNDDEEANQLMVNDQIDLDNNEEYLHLNKDNIRLNYPSAIRANRLNDTELVRARDQRLKEIQMRSFIRELLTYLCFLSLLYIVTYSNRNSDPFFQVKHLRKYFLNSRQIDSDYTTISTIDQYWNWLETSFVKNIRAQQWYNGEPPRNLSGFINDKSNRLIGWATMRQLRVKSTPCPIRNEIMSTCRYDYSFFNEDKHSYQPGWLNQTIQNFSSSIRRSFTYSTSEELDTYIYIGDHGNYGGGGYVYEFQGRLSDLQSNLSTLHQLGWIDNQTRAVIIQITLYNPNVQLFTSVTFLAEFISATGVYPTARIEPMNFYAFISILQLVSLIVYMVIIIYFMSIEIRLFFELKWKYFRRFWSFIEVGIIVCSWTSVAFYIWRYEKCQHIGQQFRETNGYVYINLQFSSYTNDILTFLLSFCCFFGTIKLIKFCRFNQRLFLFIQTLSYAGKELLAFSMIFSIVFVSFLCLFYFLFNSKLSSCSSLLSTAQMLFEMALMQFNAHELHEAGAFLGPFTFSLFVLLVVFVCLSMFLTIINDSFRRARANTNNDNQALFSFMMDRFLRWTGLKKAREEQRNIRTRTKCHKPVQLFP